MQKTIGHGFSKSVKIFLKFEKKTLKKQVQLFKINQKPVIVVSKMLSNMLILKNNNYEFFCFAVKTFPGIFLSFSDKAAKAAKLA
jgi:hypothetical protein